MSYVKITIIEDDGSKIVIGIVEETWWKKEIGLKVTELITSMSVASVNVQKLDSSFTLQKNHEVKG